MHATPVGSNTILFGVAPPSKQFLFFSVHHTWCCSVLVSIFLYFPVLLIVTLPTPWVSTLSSSQSPFLHHSISKAKPLPQIYFPQTINTQQVNFPKTEEKNKIKL